MLKNISFHLHPSERIALVGENGEGKTTIVKLLTRLYDPTSGQILLDGVDLREYDINDLWKVVGVIFQDFVKYEMTASDNIAVGRPEAREDTGLIESAAEHSRAERLSIAFPGVTSRFLVPGSKMQSIFREASGSAWRLREPTYGMCAATGSRRTDGGAGRPIRR